MIDSSDNILPPWTKVEKDTDRDFYLSAEEAKDYGIIDEVIKTKE